MSSNNYFGFAHGGTQYGQAGSYQTAQTGYAVTPASYTTQRTGYETAYTPAATNSTPATAYASTYGAVSAGATTAATYDYGYARPAATSYDAPKTYYQQPVAATYSTTEYQQGTIATKPAYSTSSAYAGAPRPVPLTTQAKVTYAPNTVSYQPQTPQPVAATYSTTYVSAAGQHQTATQTPLKQEKKPSVAKYIVPTAAATTTTYQPPSVQQPVTVNQSVAAATGATAYSATFSSPQVPVQTGAAPIQTTSALSGTPQWQTYKKPFVNQGGIRKVRPAPKPQQIHYCEVCKISCGGIMTYREHLEGQKHKKKEAAAKAGTTTPSPGRHGSSLVCELCDVTCTGSDAYAAHIRGSKHQKVVKLHTKLGKPIPASDPLVVKKAESAKAPNASASALADNDPTDMDTVEPDIEPVGQDYIEEIKTEDGKVVFNCKLCDCKFNDPNAKEMHMKGRRHRLQYKKKVDPQLVVDVKLNNRTKKLQEDRLKRQHSREEYFRHRDEWGGYPVPPMMHRPFDGPLPPMMGMGFYPPMRRPDSADDRHVINRHASIFPKKEELEAVHKIVSHNEKALKLVSDILAEESQKKVAAGAAKPAAKAGTVQPKTEEKKEEQKKVDGSDGAMFSFQQGKEEMQSRALKGAMRVGTLAKGLLLAGDTAVDLVVLCTEKPTRTLLLKVAEILPKQLQVVAPDEKYMVQKKPEDAAITVMDTKEPHNTVTITFTSPLMREQAVPEPVPADGKATSPMKPVQKDPPDVLDKGRCLDALAALRHAKWFQARAQGLQSCVMVIRIIRDLCQRVPTWAPLNSWAMELLVEKVISSAKVPLTLGDSLRRVMEAVASGLLLPGGPGLMDPCEKEPVDAVGNISNQQREDITASAQHALRLIAFRQIHKVLGMDPLPPPKFIRRFPRKRRREGSGGEGSDGGDGKKVRDEGSVTEMDAK